MSLFKLASELPCKDKKNPPHPWEKIIKHVYTGTYKYGHNSAMNPIYPPPKKDKVPSADRVKFTVVGIKTSNEFIYCMKLLNGLHKYRWKHFDAPILTGVTSVEWPKVLNDLKIKYGGELYCLQSPVAIFANEEFLGGDKELKELIESKYLYYLRPNYFVDAIKQFSTYMETTGRPCAHLDIVIDGNYVGSLVFLAFRSLEIGGLTKTLRCNDKCVNPLVLRLKSARSGRIAVLTQWILGAGKRQVFNYKRLKPRGASMYTVPPLMAIPFYTERKLYADIVPRTCDNFLRLCHEKKGGYSGTPVHRIVKDGWIQCGGYGLKGIDLDCENFIVPPDRRGVMAMANDGRHVDCSTQFFILLQPQNWMAFKYVVFGQLVIGDNTLKCIEQVPTWYESPKKDVRIANTGILNLRCEKITINKEVIKYIEGHTDDLITIGELFYEILLEKVFLEAQLRSLQRIQDEMIVGAEGEVMNEETIAMNLRTTARFMRKKEEIEKSQTDRSTKTTPAVTVAYRSQTAVDKSENNDFDVEEYEFEYMPEEYAHQQALTSYQLSQSVIKPQRPFYIPLTDVPYPGEVSSEFDLKRLLQGKYCHEGDLDRDLGKAKKKPDEDRVIDHPEILKDLFEVKSPELESQNSLDSSEEEVLRKYLDATVDHVSFSGRVIKNLAATGKRNVFDRQSKKTDLVPDEALRKYRVADYELRQAREKKVSITLPGDAAEAIEMRKEINRRQTGFVRPEDLSRLRQFELIDDEVYSDDADSDLDDYLPYTRQVSIQQPHSFAAFKNLAPEPSDSPVEKINIKSKSRSKGKSPGAGLAWKLDEENRTPRMSEVADEIKRISALRKLMDHVVADQGPAPTLIGCQPQYEEQERSKFVLVTYSPDKNQDLRCSSDDSREVYLRRRHSIQIETRKPIDDVLRLQHGKNVSRKISTDYVKTIGHIEEKAATSLRALEYAKRRPSMSVKAYLKKNKEYREKLEQESNVSMCKKAAK